MGAKRLVTLAVAVLVVGGALLWLRKPASESTTLKLCTWSNYYPESLLQQFTKDTGIKVQLSYFSSNEELLAKLKAGATGYDLIQPSDYMVRQMVRLKMIQPLDHGRLPNLKHVDPFYGNLPYDPGMQYSVPLTWGTTGLAVNTERLPIEGNEVSWNLLMNPPEKVATSLLDDMREVFGISLLLRGLSLNTHDMAVLGTIQKELSTVKSKILMFTSEPKPLLLKGEIALAQIYSTDGIQAHKANPAIRYFIPKEGATLWTDNFAIPTSSLHGEQAHRFIDYLLQPEKALELATTNQLATPNATARNLLPEEIRNDPNQYPTGETLKKLQMMEDLEDKLEPLGRLWTELKS